MEILASDLLWWPLLALIAGVLVYLRAGWLSWGLAGTTTLLAFSYFVATPWWAVSLVWFLFLVPYAGLATPRVRRRVLSDRMLERFQDSKLTSPFESGRAATSGWANALFEGKPRWRRLLRTDTAKLRSAERQFLSGPVDDLCRQIVDYDINALEGRLPDELWQHVKSRGFLGMDIPAPFGGLDLSSAGQSAVVVKIASRSFSMALCLAAPGPSIAKALILEQGEDRQKSDYLPSIARGEEVVCLAARDGGRRPGHSVGEGVVCRGSPGQEVSELGLRLHFQQQGVSLAPVASLMLVALDLHDPEGLLGGAEPLGPTLVLVPGDTAGVGRGARHNPMNLGFPLGPVEGRDVWVPLTNILGGREGMGKANTWIGQAAEHLVFWPSTCAAAARLTSRAAGALARISVPLDSAPDGLDSTAEALGSIGGMTYGINAARSLDLALAAKGDAGEFVTALVKVWSTNRCREVVDNAQDLHGEAGLCLGPHNLMGEVQKFPALAVGRGGSNLELRESLIYPRGLLDFHSYFERALLAAREANHQRAERRFDRLLARHVALTASDALRVFLHGWSGGLLVPAPARARAMRPYYRRIGRLAAVFALLNDLLILKYGAALIGEKRLVARMSDLVSELFVAGAVLKAFRDDGEEDTERPLAEWAVRDCLRRAREHVEAVLANLPGRGIRTMVRFLAWPAGLSVYSPDDELDQRVAAPLIVPSTVRDHLTRGIFQSPSADEALGRLEEALTRVNMVAPLASRLYQGKGMGLIDGATLEAQLQSAVEARLLSEEEAEMMRSAEAAREKALTVDVFES